MCALGSEARKNLDKFVLLKKTLTIDEFNFSVTARWLLDLWSNSLVGKYVKDVTTPWAIKNVN